MTETVIRDRVDQCWRIFSLDKDYKRTMTEHRERVLEEVKNATIPMSPHEFDFTLWKWQRKVIVNKEDNYCPFKLFSTWKCCICYSMFLPEYEARYVKVGNARCPCEFFKNNKLIRNRVNSVLGFVD